MSEDPETVIESVAKQTMMEAVKDGEFGYGGYVHNKAFERANRLDRYDQLRLIEHHEWKEGYDCLAAIAEHYEGTDSLPSAVAHTAATALEHEVLDRCDPYLAPE